MRRHSLLLVHPSPGEFFCLSVSNCYGGVLLWPTSITFETTNMFHAIFGTVHTWTVHGFNIGLIVSFEQFSALERTRGGVADVALNGKGWGSKLLGQWKREYGGGAWLLLLIIFRVLEIRIWADNSIANAYQCHTRRTRRGSRGCVFAFWISFSGNEKRACFLLFLALNVFQRGCSMVPMYRMSSFHKSQ